VELTPNVFGDQFSYERGSLRGEPVARKAGARELGGTLYELGPGSEDVPLHIHHALEELLVVVAGSPTLRTLEGERELRRGDVVSFPRGRRGAHAVVNRSREPVRYLMLSTKAMPEVVEYPEQGTSRVLSRAPFDPPGPDDDPADALRLLFDRSAAKEEAPRH
jgi:uncharacterized cupin superfamily protein